MDSIDFLEHGGATGSSPFAVIHHGEFIALPDPRTQHYQWVLMALYLGHVPGTPEDIPEWKRRVVFERWCAAWDLPAFPEARRLAYLVDKYRPALSNDLSVYTDLDLGDLWRARRWVKLLDVVDRLPMHSTYSATVANDEEHARMVVEAMMARRESGEAPETTGPALTTWTPEVAALYGVWDAVRRVEHATYNAQSGGKAGEAPPPLPRPQTAIERLMKRAEYDRRKAKHEALVARVLRRPAPVKAESGG